MRTTYPDDAPTVGLLAHGHRSQASLAPSWLLATRPRHRLRAPQPGLTGPVSPANQVLWECVLLLMNFARNSPATVSRYELKVLKLQRFRALLKVHAIELRATLGE